MVLKYSPEAWQIYRLSVLILRYSKRIIYDYVFISILLTWNSLTSSSKVLVSLNCPVLSPRFSTSKNAIASTVREKEDTFQLKYIYW